MRQLIANLPISSNESPEPVKKHNSRPAEKKIHTPVLEDQPIVQPTVAMVSNSLRNSQTKPPSLQNNNKENFDSQNALAIAAAAAKKKALARKAT